MKKKFMIIITILALIIVAAGLVFYFSSSVKLVPPIFIKGAIVTEKGTVIENVINSSVGQPMFLKVKKEGGILGGSEIKVIYHANNIPCVKDAIYIKAGENVEIHGVAVADDTISACGSENYYIKLLDSSIKSVNNMSAETFTVKLEIHDGSPKSLVISDDGAVTFKEGDKTNQVQVSPQVIDSLKKYILDKGFFSLEGKYDGTGCCDFIANTVVVSIGDKTHSVYCYNQCPKKFDDIIEKIESLWPYKIEYMGFA